VVGSPVRRDLLSHRLSSERLNVCLQCFAQIGDGLFFGVTFAVSRYVRNTRSVTALLDIGNDFDSELAHVLRLYGRRAGSACR